MKDYYQILGVQYDAQVQDFKRAYRRLAVQFHPDKNPAPEAEAVFKEINEAYDVLSDPEKKLVYDLQLANLFVEIINGEPQAKPQPQHRDPAYRRSRPPGPPKKSEYQLRLELMARYAPYCKGIIHIAFAFCILLIGDYVIPYKTVSGTVKANYFNISRKRESSGHILMDNGYRVRVSEDDSHKFKQGTAMKLSFSRILNIKVHAENHTGFIARLPVSIYANFSFAPIVLLIFSFVGILAKSVERIFNMGVVSFILLLLCCIFLLMS